MCQKRLSHVAILFFQETLIKLSIAARLYDIHASIFTLVCPLPLDLKESYNFFSSINIIVFLFSS